MARKELSKAERIQREKAHQEAAKEHNRNNMRIGIIIVSVLLVVAFVLQAVKFG